MHTPTRLPRKLDLPAHPRFKGFESFAAREILPRLAEMEEQRRKVVWHAKAICVAALLILATVGMLAAFDEIDMFFIIAIPLLTVLATAFGAGWPLLSFASSLGDFVLAKTCEHLGFRLSGVQPNLALERFRAARLLPRSEKHKFEDGIESDDIPFAAAEAILSDSTTDSEGRGEDETVWRGVLIEMSAPRRFEGRILVTPARGPIAQRLDALEVPRLELNLGDAGDGLEVRATNRSEARTVLTPRVVHSLAGLARRLRGEPPALALVDGHVLVAIETGRDHFEAGSIFTPIELAQHLDPILAEVADVIELADAIREALAPRPSAERAA